VNWHDYFDWMVPDHLRGYLAADPEVIVTEPHFFVELAKLLKATDRRVLANYVLWRYVASWHLQLDERFEDIAQASASFVVVVGVQMGKNKRENSLKIFFQFFFSIIYLFKFFLHFHN
jgi:hypothetical protein